MKNLIQIVKKELSGNIVDLVDSRELYKGLELHKSQYSRWVRRNIVNRFKEGIDYVKTSENVIDRGCNTDVTAENFANKYQKVTCYYINIDTAKTLAMRADSKVGDKVCKYFIECERIALDIINKPKTTISFLTEAVEHIKALSEKNKLLAEKVKEDAPKVQFTENVSASENSMLIGDFAKVVSDKGFIIGQNKMFQWLRNNKFLIEGGERKNQPMQRYINNGYFETQERTIYVKDIRRVVTTTRITGKGQIAVFKKINQTIGENL